MNIVVRVFIDQQLHSEELISITPGEISDTMERMAERHVAMMVDQPGMVEFEFLDEPDLNTRFIRIGTDPRGMVIPVQLRLPQ